MSPAHHPDKGRREVRIGPPRPHLAQHETGDGGQVQPLGFVQIALCRSQIQQHAQKQDIVGAFGGRAIASRIPQRLFDRLVIILTIVGALYLLLPIH